VNDDEIPGGYAAAGNINLNVFVILCHLSTKFVG